MIKAILFLLALIAAPCLALAAPAQHVGGDYVYAGSIDVGAPGAWDYATFDPHGGRLYIGHRDTIAVIDPVMRKAVGQVGPMKSAHGAAIAPALGRGFATSGGDGMLKVFDLSSLQITKEIPVGDDNDSIIYDPASDAVLVTVGDGKQLVIVDAKAAELTHKVDLPGEPEFLAADGHGKVFVNITTTAQLAKVDIASGKIEAVWPLTGCQRPHGLAYDRRTRRLFAGCANARLLAVDPASGRILADLPAGPANDAVMVDEQRGRVFCPNGNGTLTVVAEEPRDHFVVLRTIPTFLGARSGAVDPHTGDVFLTYGAISIKSSPRDPGGLRFGWDSAVAAVFTPND